MGRVCYVPSLYVLSLYGPSLLWAEFVMCRIDPTPFVLHLMVSSGVAVFEPVGAKNVLAW